MSSGCAVVRVLEVSITGFTILCGGGPGPTEEKEKVVEGRGRVEASQRWLTGWENGSSSLLKIKLLSSPLNNEGLNGEELGRDGNQASQGSWAREE